MIVTKPSSKVIAKDFKNNNIIVPKFRCPSDSNADSLKRKMTRDVKFTTIAVIVLLHMDNGALPLISKEDFTLNLALPFAPDWAPNHQKPRKCFF